MSARILYLSFYFEPDLCAGSFRNTPLAYELAKQAHSWDIDVEVLTTFPNRYSSYHQEAKPFENKDNLSIKRIDIPVHQSGFRDQILSFRKYYSAVMKHTSTEQYDLVFASSSRLFTAYLGYKIAKKNKIPLYLDIRDIFVDTIKDVVRSRFLKIIMLPLLKYVENKTFGYASHINLISGGFKEYFKKYSNANYSFFSNGIDDEFLNINTPDTHLRTQIKTILYAGNIGEGQGLHRIVPVAARNLGPNFKFKIIGDGGAKEKLIEALKGISNVEILLPVNRNSLIEEYKKADFLFIHLNDYEAFKKVLPSKVFELGIFQKPLIAGVNGFSRKFIEENLPGSILINPCDGLDLADKVLAYKDHGPLDRSTFIELYKRISINKKMADSILKYL